MGGTEGWGEERGVGKEGSRRRERQQEGKRERLVAKSTETLPTGRDTKVIAWQKLSSRQEIVITNLGGYCGEVLHDCDECNTCTSSILPSRRLME